MMPLRQSPNQVGQYASDQFLGESLWNSEVELITPSEDFFGGGRWNVFDVTSFRMFRTTFLLQLLILLSQLRRRVQLQRCFDADKFSGWKNFPGSFFHSYSLHSFCRTSLPLASTGWAQSTFSSRCSLSSKQHHCLTSATPTMFPKKYGVLGIEPRAAGSESKYANHCAILSPSLYSFPSFLGFHFDFDGDHKKASASPFTPSSLMRLTAEKW